MERILSKLDAQLRLILALIGSGIVFALTIGRLGSPLQAIAVWNAFAWTFIFLAWLRILLSDARTAVQTAKLQDTTRWVIFLFVILAAVTSLFAVAFLVGGAKGRGQRALTEHLLLAGATIVLLLVPCPHGVYDALCSRVL